MKLSGHIKCPHCAGRGRIALSAASVGDMICARRKGARMTQEVLSKKVGLSRPQIANIETGRSDMPLKTLERFAAALKCSMKDLVP